MRFLGLKGKKITVVSNTEFVPTGDMTVLAVDLVDTIDENDIIQNYEIWRGEVRRKDEVKPARRLRVAMVGAYRDRCGISTYAEQLFPAIGSRVEDYRIFAECLPDAKDEPNVVRCWKRSESFSDLAAQISKYDPDIVLIQHGYNAFPEARHWLSLMSSLSNFRTLVTLHNVSKDHNRIIHEAAIPEIIVHTEAAKNVLREKEFSMPIHVIPHGCEPTLEMQSMDNPYGSKHTLIQFGFGFQYKGWETSLLAVSILRETYPDIFYTGLFGENKHHLSLHENYLEKLKNLVFELGIEQNVALLNGYQGDTILHSYLRTNCVAIFPYIIDHGIHTVYAASGAARIAMQNGIPTIVSKAPIFGDLEGVCPRITDTEDLCREISRLFEDSAAHHQQIICQNHFLKTNSWENVSATHVDIFSKKP